MTEAEKRYFAETAPVLRREGFQVERLENRHLNVVLDGQPLCEVNKTGGITYRDVSTPERLEAKDKASPLISITDHRALLDLLSIFRRCKANTISPERSKKPSPFFT